MCQLASSCKTGISIDSSRKITGNFNRAQPRLCLHIRPRLDHRGSLYLVVRDKQGRLYFANSKADLYGLPQTIYRERDSTSKF